MADYILVSHVVRNTPKNNAANLVRYMGTREGVEKLPPGKDDGDATVRQQRLIKSLIETDPDSKKYLEYRDYENAPTKSNATEFIDAFIERNADRTGEIDKLVKYMAERPGVEKLGTHGLFSQTDDKIDLNAVAEEIGAHTGPIWSHVASLEREDAERLGYNNARAWRELVRRNVTELAKAHKISLDNLQWYAAFHNTTHHPHMHLLVYAKDAKRGWLNERGIEELKSALANDVFRFEQQKLFRMETELRDKLKDQVEFDLILKVREAKQNYEPTPEIVFLFRKLRSQLKDQKGKKVYGYLPKEVKATVNEIVAMLAKSKEISELYREWNQVNRQKLSLYREKKEPDLPLEANKEFQSIKNKIIQAVLELPLPEDCDLEQNISQATEPELASAVQAEKMNEHFYPHYAQMPSRTQRTQGAQTELETQELQAERVPMTVVFNEDRSAAVKAPACIPFALKDLAYALAGMLAEGQHRKLHAMRSRVDKKLRSKIEEKKAAHGLKTDGSVYYNDPYNEEQSL